MKILVTGASGLVGEEVLGALHRARHSVRILARNPESAAVQELVRQYGAEVHRGDILDAASLSGGFTCIDAVIHLVGIISEVGANTYENVHTTGTRNVLEAARCEGVKRFVHMSALGARADSAARYHRSKCSAEEAVRASGLDWTIFRPSIIYGPHDQFVNMFANMARWSPILPVMGRGTRGMRPVPVADVAKCFAGALDHPRSVGRTYDLAGPDAMNMKEIISAILDVMGKRRWKLRVPMPLARMQATVMEFVFGGILRKAPPLNRDQLVMLDEESPCDPQPANEEFGLKPVPFKQGIAVYLAKGAI